MAESIFTKDLLAQSDWLQRLARGLVHDRHRADDLAQGAVTAALATPPRSRGAGLRAWLRRVVVNRLRQDRRNEATHERLTPEVARSVEAPSTVTLVARQEIQSALIQELIGLEEPYRRTILSRYYDDRSAADIARREGQPESTVRSRLHRGLERLRERLRARYGGDDAQWRSAVAGLACGHGALLRLAKAQRLVLAGVSIVGLAVLGTVLAPFGRSPIPPGTVSTAVDGEGTPARSRLEDTASEPTGDRPAPDRQALPATAGETFEVRVRTSDDRPAPEARVRFVPLERALEENLRRGGPQHPHSEVYRFAFLAEEYGEERRADHLGRAWLPVSDERLLVSVLQGSSFATTTVPVEHRDPVTVRLAPDGVLELRTVDRAGRPAGNLPLRVAVRIPGRPDNTLWVGESGDDGAVTVRHFQLLQPAGDRSGARYGVCFDFPVQPHVTAGFDEPPPGAPVVLTVPEHGFLELTFTDDGGMPLSLPVEYCRLQVDFPGTPDDLDAFPPAERRWVGGFPRPGEHTLRLPVGLDSRITASGELLPVGEIEESTFAGPSRPGEVLTRALRLSGQFTAMRGVLQAEGSPLTGEIQVRAVLLRGGDQVAVQSPILLDAGAFEMVVRSGERPTALYLHVHKPEAGELGAELSLPDASVVALGNVELAPLTRILEGQVVDERGLPVSGAEIQAWRWSGAEWERDRRFLTLAGEDGGFRLFLPESEVGHRLLPQRRGYLVREPLVPGPEALEMVRSAAVSGSLVLPDWLESALLSVHFLPVHEGPALEVEPRRRGQRTVFRAPGLWPGRYRVRLQLDGEPEPFRELGVLDLAAGEESSDDRLMDIDLRNDLFRIELTAADERGNPLDLPGAGLTAFLSATDGTVRRRNLPWRDGRAVVVTSRPSLDVELTARGHITWRGIVHPGRAVLTLRPEG